MPNILEGFCILFRVLNEYINDKLMLAVFGRQVSRLLVVAPLSAHGDSCIEVKFKIARRLNKSLELLDIFQLCIAIQKKRGVVCGCFMVFVQFLQILDEIVNSLSVQKLVGLAGGFDHTTGIYIPFESLVTARCCQLLSGIAAWHHHSLASGTDNLHIFGK